MRAVRLFRVAALLNVAGAVTNLAVLLLNGNPVNLIAGTLCLGAAGLNIATARVHQRLHPELPRAKVRRSRTPTRPKRTAGD